MNHESRLNLLNSTRIILKNDLPLCQRTLVKYRLFSLRENKKQKEKVGNYMETQTSLSFDHVSEIK